MFDKKYNNCNLQCLIEKCNDCNLQCLIEKYNNCNFVMFDIKI